MSVVEWGTHVSLSDVDGFVEQKPRDRLLATRLRQRTVICDVIRRRRK